MRGSDFGSIVDDFFVVLVVACPLALWKLVEIVLWLVRNVRIEVGP